MKRSFILVFKNYSFLILVAIFIPFLFQFFIFKFDPKPDGWLLIYVFLLIVFIVSLIRNSVLMLRFRELSLLIRRFLGFDIVLNILDFFSTFYNGKTNTYSLYHASEYEANILARFILNSSASPLLIIIALLAQKVLLFAVLYSFFIFTGKLFNKAMQGLQKPRRPALKNKGNYMQIFINNIQQISMSLYYFLVPDLKNNSACFKGLYPIRYNYLFGVSFRCLFYFIIKELFLFPIVLYNIFINIEEAALYSNEGIFIILEKIIASEKYVVILFFISIYWLPKLFMRKYAKNDI